MSSKKERLLAEIEAEKAIDEVMSKTKAEREKELADAGFDLKAETAKLEALVASHGKKAAKPEAEPAPKVVSLEAHRRKRFGFTPAWMAAAAVAALVAGTVATTIALRDDVLDDHNVASGACDIYRAQMKLEGTVRRDGDGFALDLKKPLCGPQSELVAKVPLLTPPGAPDLAPLVGRRARIEGAVLERDAGGSPLVVEVRTASGL